MSRRGRIGVPITLFSFQDIITSVSGVIIVMVLLLSIELIQRPGRRSQADEPSGRADVANAVRKAEEEINRLRQQRRSADDLTSDLAAVTPASLREEVASAMRSIEALRSEILDRKTDADRLNAARQGAINQRQEQAGLLESLSQSRREVDDFQRQVELERKENRTVFALPAGFNKEGWLAVVESDRIATAPIGRPQAPKSFAGTGRLSLFGKTPTEQVVHWISESDRNRAYLFVLVRPSGVSEFHRLRTELQKAMIEFGFDLIGETQTVLHPERGAAL